MLLTQLETNKENISKILLPRGQIYGLRIWEMSLELEW